MRHTKGLLLCSLFVVTLALPAYAAQATLAWDYPAGTSAVGFYIYKQPGCVGGFTVVQTQTVGLTTWTDTQLNPGQSYCWKVSAVNGEGKEGPFSSTASFQVPAELPPAPTNLRLVSTSTLDPLLMNVKPPQRQSSTLPAHPCPAWGTVRPKDGLMMGCPHKLGSR